MKKLVIVSPESLISGCVRSGVAEVTDSLANAMTAQYAVCLVCPDGDGPILRLLTKPRPVTDGVRSCRLFGVDYYLIRPGEFGTRAAQTVSWLQPDILHNWADPELLCDVSPRPDRCVYTVDQKRYVKGKEAALLQYDAVTTVSESYARELLEAGDTLADTLRRLPFTGISNGILTQAFSPEKGLFLAAKYTALDQRGKAACKEKLLQTYGIPGDPCLYLMAGRLVKEKGVEAVLEALPHIKESGGFVLFVGKGDDETEKRLSALTREEGALNVGRWMDPTGLIPILAGGDFLLQVSEHEPGGLMPMTAARYGTVPIVTVTGGLKDSMDGKIAIPVTDGLEAAIDAAAALYRSKLRLFAKRQACMRRDFSWDTRKHRYMEVYEQEGGAPGELD